MKIQIVSDLHLEFAPITINNYNGCEVLVLAGDICVVRKNSTRYKEFLKDVSSKFQDVLYVFGNHEYYGNRYDSARKTLQDILYELNIHNIYVLDKSSIFIRGVTFFGATMWSDFDNDNHASKYVAKNSISDFSQIIWAGEDDQHQVPARLFRPDDAYSIYRSTKKRLDSILTKMKNERFVVITHFLPTYKSVNERWEGSPLNAYYIGDCMDLMSKHHNIEYWIHGHTHDPVAYDFDKTKVVCNPRGYPHENDHFIENFFIEI